jgi:hypothetical protein
MPQRRQATKQLRNKLSPQEERFCVLYSSDREFFGNGVQAYIEAFDTDLSKKGAYNRAKTAAFKLLTRGNILDRINELLELRGLNDPFVDKQLELVVTQNASFDAKIKAIREYNSLRGRYKQAGMLFPTTINQLFVEIRQTNMTYVQSTNATYQEPRRDPVGVGGKEPARELGPGEKLLQQLVVADQQSVQSQD